MQGGCLTSRTAPPCAADGDRCPPRLLQLRLQVLMVHSPANKFPAAQTRRALMTAKPSSKRILCIEDEPDMIDLIRLILERRDFIVQGAEGGNAGLKAVRDSLPDLVLLDLMMPDMDGWDVYQQIKSDPATRRIPVIIVTARAQSIDRLLGLEIAKVDDYIVKPFSPQQLLDSVEKVLGQHKDLSS